ncbi:ankyrin repeat domain-containing protein SOWAHA [Latimeria chalumnae]|uniref:ankyrin repeat domain-containing protein SOWAHA n=1 Tax=Latimeria chalumnae TaxID=7897 RepID=UPI0003C19367|nr:PREDICTED: ankyrin repeat domain-containing protein SOWAHA [Latimeria chalumnae]|eukprot:XP_006003253.1 PREDICTED: ankyrin repeat domain-containing protein SOWAHA [Latimeria chalumnae]
MAFTQDVVLAFLLERNGKVKNSDLLGKFKPLLQCSDPNEKATKRELFKRYVNNIAVVREEEGVKFVLLKKKYQHLLKEEIVSAADNAQQSVQEHEDTLSNFSAETVESLSTCSEPGTKKLDSEYGKEQSDLQSISKDKTKKSKEIGIANEAAFQNQDPPVTQLEICKLPQIVNPVDLCKENVPLENKEVLSESPLHSKEINSDDEDKSESDNKERRRSVLSIVTAIDRSHASLGSTYLVLEKEIKYEKDSEAQKPSPRPMLPLRYPQPVSYENNRSGGQALEENENNPEEKNQLTIPGQHVLVKSPKMKRRQHEETGSSSPHLKRMSKTLKVSEDTKYSEVPLESAEHEWLVKAAAGHWTQLHGLLIKDCSLTEKKDFISGYTALHWAAKSGNSDMVSKIIETAKSKDIDVDVNSKSYGGYTPLHLATMHGHEDIIFKMVRLYNAKVNVRDYSGKKPYQYLPKEAAFKLKQILGDPDIFNFAEQAVTKRGSKVAHSLLSTTNTFLGVLHEDANINVHDLAKGFRKSHNFGRLFHTPTMSKKKYKSRGTFSSLSEDLQEEEEEEEEEETTFKRRPVTEIFFN